MDKRRLDALVKGYNMKREQVMNDSATVGHTIAGKIAEAVWGSKKFSRPIKPFKFKGVKVVTEQFKTDTGTNANDNKELVQSFDNQFQLFLKEGGFIGGE
jgi:hypothetical protein